MSLRESVKIESLELAKFFHDILLGYMDFTMGIVPKSRLKKVTSYLDEAMYHLMEFNMLGLIKFNDPASTLEGYCQFLEENDLAVKVSLGSRKESFGSTWSITFGDCLFGNSCRNLRSERFMCPLALFAGFLAQEAGSERVRMDTSRLTMFGCKTEIRIIDEALTRENIILSG